MTAISFRHPPGMAEHNLKILVGGEYDVPGLELEGTPTILDIGAHAGAFSVWAIHRWPKAQIIAYEPQPDIYEQYLLPNISHEPAIRAMNVAVRARAGKASLGRGRGNPGEASFHNDNEERIEVECISVASLSNAEILKIDTEGCEVEIVETYLETHPWPKAVLLEFHSAKDRLRLDELSSTYRAKHHYDLVRGQIHHKDMGTLCYVRP